MSTRRVLHTLALAALFAALPGARAQAQQTGSITGRVTDAASGQPIAAAQVNVVGTALGAQTNSEGQYVIRGVNPGAVQLRALRVGFSEATQGVTVAAGQSATADIRMRAVPISLDPVVTTATGQQRRVEVGNAIATVDAAELVETRAVSNMADVLVAKAPGVQVFAPTQTGAGTRIRIRGTSSMALTNNPIYVIDGVRVEGTTGSSSVSVGGTTPSRVGDLNPEEIESIEIVKGPSAATLYGTDAANGVVVIRTKRGVAGRPQWTYYTEQTAIRDENDYPTAYTGWRSTTTPVNLLTTQCFLFQVSAGSCTQDSVTAFNPVKDKETTPFGTGYRQQHGLQVRGGSETVRYFLHGEWEDEDGVTKVPEFDERYLASRNLSLRSDQRNPNTLNRVTARANLNINLPWNADLAVNAGYITQDLQLVSSDDSGTLGVAANTYGGPGYKYNVTAAGDTLWGWRQFTPRHVYQRVTAQGIERFIGSVNSNWGITDWLSLRGNFGVDFIGRHDTQLCRFSECADVGQTRLGSKEDNRSFFYIYTVDAAATATRRLTESIESKTTAGFQFYRNLFNRNGAYGQILPPGATTVTAGAVQSADETTTESRTLGGFIEQNLAFGDRFFLTGAVRSDRNSAFGADFETVFYPKLAASWVISEEGFFPELGWLNQLRLRSAYGASGVQPGTIDAVQFYTSTAARVVGEAGDQPAVVYSSLGNRNLKPERSTEFEAGVDGTFWNNRLTTELTYYKKVSTDALIERVLPPSLGTGATDRLENLGEVQNWGWEALINAQLVDGSSFGWDVTLNGSTNDNELTSLGGLPTINISSTQQHREGYPLYGWWVVGLNGYADANGNGLIELDEIQVDDERTFQGYSNPKHEVALTSGIEFWDRRLRLAAMVDYKGGHLVYNNTERIRCSSRNNCSGLINPESSAFEQARVVLVRQHSSRSVGGFLEDGDFLRLREVGLTFSAPEEWAARAFRGRSLVATLAARNLGVLWTKYTGVDPEAFGTTGDAPSSFQAFAPPTYYTLRVSLGF